MTARDAAGNTSTDVVTVTYNTPPALASIVTQSTAVGQPASLQLVASDADGDLLTYTASGLPPGLTVTMSSGLIGGTPNTPGTYTVTAIVLMAHSRAYDRSHGR